MHNIIYLSNRKISDRDLYVLTERLKGHYGNTKVGDFPVKTVCLRLRHVSSLLYQWLFAWFLQACNQPVGIMGD